MTADGADVTSRKRRLGFGVVVVLALGALALTVGVGIVRSMTTPVERVPVGTGPSDAPDDAVRSADVYVHVSGAVRSPGLYRLTAPVRVADAIAAAGGFADDAERGAVNLARDLKDGEQIAVPVVGAAPPPAGPGSPAGPVAGGPVNLNLADAAALDTLPGIGPALAQRIIDWRTAHGSFTSVDDLGEVSGIGEKVLAAVRDLVTV